MCGIAGLFGLIKERELVLQSMLESIRHRGPDDGSVFVDDAFCGGMRRLSIVDLVSGNQPFYNENRSVVMFYNGEIYNYKILKKNLIAKGYKFRTESDGEVIVHLYDELGESLFEKLDGMFAVSIWDREKKRLILARDSYGEKPLYYAKHLGGALVYGSELKCIEQVKELRLTVDKQAVFDMPTFLWIPGCATPYLEVKELEREHLLIVDENSFSLKKYKCEIGAEVPPCSSDKDAIAATREIVECSVKSRLLSDVPVGCFLSGGLDSSIVSTIAAKNLAVLDTFTIAFEDIDDPIHGKADESAAAAETANIIGSRHHTIRVRSKDFRAYLDDFCKFGDMPWAVSSGLGVMAISKAAREVGIKVLLNGDGADEAFGGYSWYAHLDNLVPAIIQSSSSETISFNNFGLPLVDRLAAMNSYPAAKRAWSWHYYADDLEKRKIFSTEISENSLSPYRFFRDIPENALPTDFVSQDRNFYFPFEMLRKADRMTMAYSVEGRTPFASPSIQKLVRNLSFDKLVRDGELKWVLRRAFDDILPKNVIQRPKHGFNVPIDHWLNGEWSDLVEEAFCEGSTLRRLEIVGKNSLSLAKSMLKEKTRLNGHSIFSFIMLGKWFSQRF